MKATASYRMGKQNKRDLIRIADPHLRGALARAIVQADLQAMIKPRTDKSNKEEVAVEE